MTAGEGEWMSTTPIATRSSARLLAFLLSEAMIKQSRFWSTLWVPIIHPCWSGSMPVLMEGAAESVASADVEVRDPLRIGDRSG